MLSVARRVDDLPLPLFDALMPRTHFYISNFEVKKGHGLVLTEIEEGVTVEQVKAATQAPFTVSSQLKSM